MREMLTDELLEVFYNSYYYYKEFLEISGMNPMTFDDFVQRQISNRDNKMKNLKESGFSVY